MNIAFFCIFFASILPILFIGFAKFTGGFKLGNNHDPRKFLAKAEGKQYRAKCAHDNSWEAFGPFAAAVILATISSVSQPLIDNLALCFIGARVFYGISYILDLPSIRSLLYFIAITCVVALFYLSWSA
jgi:uncharacterized MAPEG superfamily protein